MSRYIERRKWENVNFMNAEGVNVENLVSPSDSVEWPSFVFAPIYICANIVVYACPVCILLCILGVVGMPGPMTCDQTP